jgi:hypothetical protein
MNHSPSPLAGLFQLAYVTRDMDAAKALLAREHGIGEYRAVAESPIPLTIPANSTVLMDVQVAWVGDWMIELIQPLSGAVDIYAQGLPDGDGIAFHHIGAIIGGARKEWDSFRAGLDESRIAIEGGRERMRFTYVDERQTLGHYVEYLWMDEELLSNSSIWSPAKRHIPPMS